MIHALLRRLLLVAVALALGGLGLLAERQRTRVARLDLGLWANSAAVVEGWVDRETAFGVRGRWTTGDALLVTPRAGRDVTALRAFVCAHPRRPGDRLRVGAGPLVTAVRTLGPGCQVVDVPVDRAPADTPLAVRLTSLATTEPGRPQPLGVFVTWLEVEADGPVAWRRSAPASAALVVLFAGVLLAAWDAAALASGTRLSGPIAAACAAMAVAWTAVALIGPTVEELRHAAWWAAGTAALVGVVRAWSRIASAPAGAAATPPAAGSIAWPLAALVGAVALICRDTVLHGYALSQSDLLFQVHPWLGTAPPGLEIQNPLLADIPLVFYPYLVQIRDALAEGTFPLWSTRLYTGHPFFASFQSALLSPFTWIAVAVPLPWGTVAGAAARLLAGGLGALLYARRIGLGAAAAAFCAIAIALSTFNLIWLEHPVPAVGVWLPWLLWGAERVAGGTARRNAALLAALVGVTLLAGHPETALKVLALGGLYGLARAAATPPRLRTAAWIVAAYAAGLALSAVQVVPFAEYLHQSRAHALRQAITTNPYFLPADTAIAALVPDFWGHPRTRDHVARTNRVGVGTNYAEQQTSPGVVAWVLAAVGLVAGWRRWRVWFFATAAVVSAALAFSLPAVVGQVTALPLLRMTIVSRFSLTLIAAVVVLAAVGLDALWRADAPAPEAPASVRADRLAVAAVVTAVVLVALIGWATDTYRADLASAGLLGRTAAAGLFASAIAALTAALAAGRARARVGRTAFATAIVAIVAAEQAAFATAARSWVPPAAVFPVVDSIAAVQRDSGLFRVMGFSNSLPPNTGMAFGLADPRGYDGMGPQALSDLLDVSLVFLGSYHQANHVEGSPLVDLLNVKYVFTPPGRELAAPQFARVPAGGAPVYVNTRALPRLFLADGYEVRTGNAARRALRDGAVDLRRVALLEQPLAGDDAPEHAGDGGPGSVRVRHYRNHLVEVDTQADGRRLLVLTDLFYPGWRADVDGREVPIHRANFAFRAVSVPAGTHTVRFRFAPDSVRVGGLVSAIALTLVVAAAAWPAGRRAARA